MIRSGWRKPRTRKRMFICTALAAMATGGLTASPAFAGFNCYFPQELTSGACSTTGLLNVQQASGWKNANGTFRLQYQVKLSVFPNLGESTYYIGLWRHNGSFITEQSGFAINVNQNIFVYTTGSAVARRNLVINLTPGGSMSQARLTTSTLYP